MLYSLSKHLLFSNMNRITSTSISFIRLFSFIILSSSPLSSYVCAVFTLSESRRSVYLDSLAVFFEVLGFFFFSSPSSFFLLGFLRSFFVSGSSKRREGGTFVLFGLYAVIFVA
eukprot:TRINITY_DN2454_c0_g4_i2.p4 TRINITY_DN2454_c0_g4~~TRINITY_DN2454_c0_g4_i2.p4  ORF type:complete len:114 (-),score=7.80 TRINITY_DN2454_c0_g4_i2:505-846(-)